MPIETAIKSLERRLAYENEQTAFVETIDCFPQDGAAALQRVLAKRYGWAQAEKIPSWFGDTPPMMVSVEVGPRGESIQVPWGRFSIPGVKGYIQTGTGKIRDRMAFQINALVLRKHEDEVKGIADDVRREVAENSLYRGKSVKLKFTDEGNPFTGNFRVPNITFMDVSGITEDSLVYSEHVRNAILTNLITPLEHRERLKKYGLPFKRGVLLAGVYGTGKTLAAFFAANRANANGITFVYVEQANEFAEAVTFARQYAPAVLFCEDIDRVTSGTRDSALDSILNIVDGLDAKSSDLMVVVTTNNVESIQKGMLRPGRLDAIIEVEPPDAEAVQKLIRLYGRGLIDPTANLARVGALLQGQIPAVVREVVERSKLAALRLGSFSANGELLLTGDALVDSAHTMRMQIDLLNRTPEATPSELEMFGRAFGNAAGKGLRRMAESMVEGKRLVLITATDSDNEFSGHLPDDGDVHMYYGDGEVTSEVPDGALEALAAPTNHRS